MKIFQQKQKVRSLLIAILLSMSFMAIIRLPSAFGYTVPNQASQTGTALTLTTTMTVANAGDLIVIGVEYNDGSAPGINNIKVTGITGTKGETYKLAQDGHINIGATCQAGRCLDSEVWYASTTGSGLDSIAVTVLTNSGNWQWESFDVVGVGATVTSTSFNAYTGVANTAYSTSALAIVGGFAFSSVETNCPNGHALTAGTGYTGFVPGGALNGGSMFATTSSSAVDPTNFSWTCSFALTNWIDVGVIFGGLFTCSINNLDAGNYVVGNAQKFYQLECMVASSAISGNFQSPITDVRAEFNDSNVGSCVLTCFSTALPNNVILDLNNGTGGPITSIIQGQSITSLKGVGDATVQQKLNAATGVRSINVTWPFSLNGNVVNAFNRGIQLFASLANGASRGFVYVKVNYFNILVSGQGGGSVSKLQISGLCSVPPGADVFQTLCQYNASPKSWIAENATYYQLEQYQGQFALETADAFGNPSPYYWERFNESGLGCRGVQCPSSNSGDWKIDTGLYSWDNSSKTCCWVKGIHVTLQMITGRVGSSNLWTKFAAAWFNGRTLIKNDTFFAFVPSNGGQGANGQLGFSQVNIWLNFWYSQNNGSTSQGGEVGAYYTGMHKNAYLIWTSWSPFLANNTQSQVFVPLKDNLGNIMTAQQAQFTRVFMNMSRPGAPSLHAGQDNFQIRTTNFQEQEFNVASAGMTGITTPVFATAIVPTITSGGLFAPLVNAIKAIASYIVKGFQALGTLVWNALGARFPWFTTTLTTFANFIGQAYRFTIVVLVYIVQALQVIYNGLALVAYPITVIGKAWGTIQGIFSPVFTGANLNAMMILVVLWIFSGYIIDAAERNDTKAFINLAVGAWRVTNALAYWTWLLAKFFVDAIEGLIP